VIHNAIKGVRYEAGEEVVELVVGAGEVWDELVADSVAHGYWGLENLSSIPGTVGATPIQNVGAYGVEVSQLITAVKCIHADTLEEKLFSNSECGFGYRDSFFKSAEGKKWIVVEVVFLVKKNPQPILEYKDVVHLKNKKNLTAKKIRDEVIKIRAGKFPDWHTVGTAGSFFKNPTVSKEVFAELKKNYTELPGYETDTGEYKVSLGWILDKALHLKGYCQGGVCLFQEQALVLVSHSGDSDAIKNFYQEIQSLVKEKINILIEPEVQIIKNK
jgi:UDP-N-acetylmuramate dehydrogenase